MNSSDIENYVQERFPEWSSILVHDLTEITSGWETRIFSFDVEFKIDSKTQYLEWIARVYPGSEGEQKGRFEYSVMKEMRVMYPVPEVFLFESKNVLFNSPFVIMERISGETLWNRFACSNPLSNENALELFTDCFVTLHQLNYRDLSIIPNHLKEIDPIQFEQNRLSERRMYFKSREVDFLITLVNWMEERVSEIDFKTLSILHRDFHPNNILLDERGNPYVIDWTAASIGDFRHDLAWTALLTHLYIDEDFSFRIIQEYERVSKASILDFDYFRVNACLRRLSDVYLSLKFGSEEMGMLESTKKVMRDQIGLVSTIHEITESIMGYRIDEIDSFVDNIRNESQSS